MIKFYKTMPVPILLYGCENWVLSHKDKLGIQAAEMKVLWIVKDCT